MSNQTTTAKPASSETSASTTPLTPRNSTQGMGRRKVVDQTMRALTWFAGLLAIIPLVWILVTVISRGAPLLFSTQPDYTRVCTVAVTNNDRYHEPYQRVAESQCTSGAAGASYRYLQTGVYPAVGQDIDTLSSSVSQNPTTLNPKASIAAPSSDGRGTVRFFSLGWWTKDLSTVPDQTPGGGAIQAIVGTLWIGLITSVIAVPLGVLGAIYLVEYARGTRAGRIVSFMVDILTGIPSIVAALFIFAVWITTLGLKQSTFASSLALVLLMLPTVLRSTEEMLKLVPDTLREASFALGVPRWRTIISVVLPTARTGILTGIVLGMARVMGETAPLLILLNYAKTLTFSPFSNTMGSLPTMIANAAALPASYPGAARGWGAALTLILLVMGLNLIARAIGRSGPGKEKKKRGGRRARAVPSAATAYAAAAADSATDGASEPTLAGPTDEKTTQNEKDR